jgi:tRNA (guanine37-N1)-methyltransferase
VLIDILTLFPDYFTSPLDCSMLKRAIASGVLQVNTHDIREFALDKHRSVDDKPYGGGTGMLLKGDVLIRAVESLKRAESTVVYLSAQGSLFNAKMAESFASSESHIILLCGHYEGIDERVVQSVVDYEVCIGDFVLTNGGPAALVFIDATSRFLKNFFKKERVAAEDTFHCSSVFEGPRYTRPAVIEFEGKELCVPEVLLSGDPKKVAQYVTGEAQKKLREHRPDLCLKE